jgi:hypothetical protein
MSDPKPVDPANPEPSPDATVRLAIGAPADPLATQRLNIAEHLKADSTVKVPLDLLVPPADQTQRLALSRKDEPPIRVQRTDAPVEAEGQTMQRPPLEVKATTAPFGWKVPIVLGVAVALTVAGYMVYSKGPGPQSTPSPQTTNTSEIAPPPGVQVYMEQAKAGDVHAMRMLGAYYYNGLNVPQDREKGLYWYRKAAEKGSDAAKSELKQIEGVR